MTAADIIVIGSGISGLNFALQCAAQNLSVLIVTKKRMVESGTNYAQGGIAAVLQATDNFEKHVRDTLRAGSFHNNRRAVEFMVRRGPDAIARLVSFGVPFATEHGKIVLTREGGHSHRRIAFVGDYTGKEIERALVLQAKKHPRITILEHAFVTDLLVQRGRCYGIELIMQNRVEQRFAPVTVLASGGLGQIYAHTTNPAISTGDGYAMAFRADCDFSDMEFIQFHPTALDMPGKRHFLLSEALRGEGAILQNYKKERFMPRYHKDAELAPRDVVAYAVFLELQKGPVYLNMTAHATKTKIRFPTIYQTLKRQYDLNLTRDLIPIAPAAHFCCGGIKVDLRGRTDVRGLYAFGEVAGTGVHGANRLASNSLLEALVFSSSISEEIAAVKKKKTPHPRFSKLPLKKLTERQERLLGAMRRTIRAIMWEHVGVVRTGEGLKTAIKLLSELHGTIPEKRNIETIEVKNMIETGLLVSRAALKRKKSLGCHVRDD